jgi:hypothetical protein
MRSEYRSECQQDHGVGPENLRNFERLWGSGARRGLRFFSYVIDLNLRVPRPNQETVRRTCTTFSSTTTEVSHLLPTNSNALFPLPS